jgi:hypothetical protein
MPKKTKIITYIKNTIYPKQTNKIKNEYGKMVGTVRFLERRT